MNGSPESPMSDVAPIVNPIILTGQERKVNRRGGKMVLGLFSKPKKQKSRRASLKKALDVEMSKQVRERDKHRCKHCGKEKVYHHHIFTKTRLTTRWDMENGVSLCFFCHRWAHAAGEEFRQWVLSWMPQAEYDKLYLRSQMRGGFKEIDLEWFLKELKGE